MAGLELIVDSDDIIQFKLIRDGTVTQPRHHDCRVRRFFDEVFRADQVIESLAYFNFAEVRATLLHLSTHFFCLSISIDDA